MRGKAGTFAAAAVLTVGLAVPAAVGAASVLKTRMTGAQIVNEDGGAPRGVAEATLRLNDARGRVCFDIDYSGLGGRATAGYVRHGRRGQTARPAIVLFTGRSASPVKGCVGEVGKRTLSGLSQHPGGYSVDLATAKLPKGAVRGQLRSASEQQLEGPPSGGIGK